jgi:NAD(P)-dependent dehydrogenase (short-subunit alcohol dehydrogenase family)
MRDDRVKIVLVTGANSGIGFETSRTLAERGAHVVMVSRDGTRGARARDAIAAVSRGPTPDLFLVDLSSQREIRRLSDELHARYSHLDVLVHNAGAVFGRRELTEDGIEKTFATNHLASFLLTDLTLDLLRGADRPRVVSVTSETHSGHLDFGNLQGEESYGFLDAYARTKLCNVLFTYELARRLRGDRITANCASPGPSRTHFGDNVTGVAGLFPRVMKGIPILFRKPEYGARTIVYAAVSSELEGVTGRFFLRGRERRTKPITYDEQVARRLWSVSASLCGIAEGVGWEPEAGHGTRRPVELRADRRRSSTEGSRMTEPFRA